MDLVSKRYSNPCFFMDGMIQTGRFCEFVSEFVETTNKEKEDKMNWEYFLHKVFEGSFADFIAGIETDKSNKNMSERTIETTVQESINILNNFNPTQKGVNN